MIQPSRLNFNGEDAPRIRKNNSWTFVFSYTNADGTYIDVSGYNIAMQIRKTTLAEPLITLSTESGNVDIDSNGDIVFSLTVTETSTLLTGKHLYDITFINLTTPETDTFTLLEGEVEIVETITR